MMFEGVLPAISKQLACEAGALSALPVELRDHIAPWEKNLKHLAEIKCGILEKLEMLDAVADSVKDGDAHAAAKTLAGDGASLMESIRADSDEAERLIAKELWPYPTYTDMFRIEDFKL